MPAIYAHNQFGNRVLQQVDLNKRKMILKNLRQFRIGLQGPDYLFFYKPLSNNAVNRIGYRIHERPVREFMEHAKKVIKAKGTDSPEYGYMLGFICHFALDSECHSFVADEIARTGVQHIEIESEFEKFLMRKDGEDPFAYPVGKTFPTDRNTAECIANLYEEVSVDNVLKALKSMRWYKNILVAPGRVKHTAIDCVMRLSGQYDTIKGHLLRRKDNPKCRKSNEGLYTRFLNAVNVAEELIKAFDAYLDGEELSERFNRNFE